jgi:hypothetical protein
VELLRLDPGLMRDGKKMAETREFEKEFAKEAPGARIRDIMSH